MITLEPFTTSDFEQLISWINNPELLFTIAGYDLSFPLTADQLNDYLKSENSHAFKLIDAGSGNTVGHAELLVKEGGRCKIDKLIIGDQSIRGKGIGQASVNALLKYAFEQLGSAEVELNVFDWNVAGIRCYEKCGFSINPGHSKTFEFDDKSWVAHNMIISRPRWMETTA